LSEKLVIGFATYYLMENADLWWSTIEDRLNEPTIRRTQLKGIAKE